MKEDGWRIWDSRINFCQKWCERGRILWSKWNTKFIISVYKLEGEKNFNSNKDTIVGVTIGDNGNGFNYPDIPLFTKIKKFIDLFFIKYYYENRPNPKDYIWSHELQYIHI